MILSVIDQLNIRKVAMTHSDNPEFNEFMDACSAADGLDAISKTIEEKTQPKSSVEHQEKDD